VAYFSPDGFDSIDPSDCTAVLAYFQRHFPDVVPLMPQLAEDFARNPVGSLVTVRTSPWLFGRHLLIGDAAHAVVPFYGQGSVRHLKSLPR
jgi:kynurenine 3-monooxygenase